MKEETLSGVKCTNNQRRSASGRSRRPQNLQQAREYGYTEREWQRINAQDERERRKNRQLGLIILILALIACMMGYFVWYSLIRSHDYDLSIPFDKTSTVYGFGDALSMSGTADSFASGLCVSDDNVNTDAITITSASAGLFDTTSLSVMYGKDMFTERSEASLTKIMTALVALENGNLDDQVTVTDTAADIEYGSSVCGISTGDVLSLRQLLYGLLIASGNDAAMMIAEHVGGSVDNFVDMMNERAREIGATHTAFKNPSGLTEEGHYTCIYDLYLIFNEACKNDTFLDIINRTNYYAEYTDGSGNAVAATWESTNHYFTGEAVEPDNVIIYGGKTGTTDDAGACLCLLTKDLYGDPYIAIILHSEDKDFLYQDMNQVLRLIA